MRDTSSWRKKLTRQLRSSWFQTVTSLKPGTLLDVELGLYLLSQLAPEAPAHALWVMLAGYSFSVPEIQAWSAEQQRMLGNARHLLPYFRSPYHWRRTLERYRQLDERLRGYDVDEECQQFSLRAVSVCPERLDVYATALRHPLPYNTDPVRWATPGTYLCSDRRYFSSVNIPADLVFLPPAGHDLLGRARRPALSVTWDELLATARWMDVESEARGLPNASWERRLIRVRLELLNQDGTLAQADTLTLDGLMHLIGMVSSGKSTLMDVLAVWASRQGLRVILVVEDVIGALARAQQFLNLGISVAPVLGASNRERHINRLHRVLAAEQPLAPLLQEHAGFRWLSTACALDGLRETERSFQMGAQPCLTLARPSDSEDDEQAATNKLYACPLYSACPFHQGQRDLVTASIWIATPASLVYTRVAPQLNAERVRFAELVYRCSDLIIVDEADRVQVQLDSIFSPSQTLVSRRGDAWLGRLWQQVVPQLNQEGRGQLADESVGSWCKAHDTAQRATSQIYALLLQEPALRGWIEQRDYFTDWLLLDKLALALSGASDEARETHPGYRRLMRLFDDYLDELRGEKGDHPLAELVRRVLADTNEDLVRQRIGGWISEQKEPTVTLSNQELADAVVRLEFALLVAVLQDRLNLLLREWRQVETALQLEGGSSILLHTPPRDFEAVIPVAPMGNVLAFQYMRSLEEPNGPGDLRFFRCQGVGRWLLLHLHELFASDGLAGPHILLLSGTSWAGTAPGFHIQVPVQGVLRAPEVEVEAIAQSTFRFLPLYDDNQNPLSVSGAQGGKRIAALKELLYQLARRSGLSGISLLEKERDSLPARRQRLLLLVGSYEEAKLAHEFLENLRPDWQGQIRHLVPDDDEFESQWRGGEQSLQRGLVHQFAQTGAWILIAPLLAVERGHNILNEDDEAAIGAAYFLVRPHPRPDDISYAIHSINRWAVEHYANASWLANQCQDGILTLDRVGIAFRDAAYHRWRFLLHMPMIYSTLPHSERDAVTWTQLVTIWQVIGRLVRGGSPAKVFFCDAAFARHTVAQNEQGDLPSTSLLVGMKQVLRPYFTPDSHTCIPVSERQLVQALYGPFYQALESMGGVADATTI